MKRLILVIMLISLSVLGCAEKAPRVEKNLIWVCDMALTRGTDPVIFEELNRLLVTEYDCDFTVEFLPMNSFSHEEYRRVLEERKKSDQQVDILFTGLGSYNVSGNYSWAVDKELLLPLTDYLTKDGTGKALYEQYTPDIWDSLRKADGEIYGIDIKPQSVVNTYLLANAELVDKSVIEMLHNVEDVLTYLETITAPGDICPLCCFDTTDLLQMTGYWKINGSAYTKKNGQWRKAIIEEDSLVKRMNACNGKYAGAIEQTTGCLTEGRFLFAILSQNLNTCNNNRLLINGEKIIDVTVLQESAGCIQMIDDGVTGIAS